jgi:hypothetical protein
MWELSGSKRLTGKLANFGINENSWPIETDHSLVEA